MRERGHGHITNVSSLGVQASTPRYSAYVASKAALDAFTRVVSAEQRGDGITFTTIHMPLVRTPMIAPTKLYESFPAISAEEAADDLRIDPTQAKDDGHTPRHRRRALLHARSGVSSTGCCTPRTRRSQSRRRPMAPRTRASRRAARRVP